MLAGIGMGEEVGKDANFFWELPTLRAEEEEVEENCIKINKKNEDSDWGKNKDEGGGRAATGKKRAAGGGGEDDDDDEMKRSEEKELCDEHELHIWTERERRKKMRNMFASLHALLPHLPPKADKTSIVDEAINHIKKLQQTLDDLQKQKLQQQQGHHSSTVQTLAIQSREAFLADQCSPVTLAAATLPTPIPRPEFPSIFKTWTSPNLTLSLCGYDAHFSLCSVRKPGLLTAVCFVLEKHKLEVVSAQASSNWNRCLYMIHVRANVGSERFMHAFPVEAIYKQAAAEIMLWMNS